MTNLSASDKAHYAEEVRQAIIRLNHHYGSECPVPSVQWTLRGVGTLGQAHGTSLIKLNAQYAAAMGRDEYRQTVLHEVCHIVTTWRRINQFRLPRPYGSGSPWSAHGTEWKKAMRTLGLRPDRTAKVSAEVSAQVKPARQVNRVPVVCKCTTHWVTQARADRIKDGALAKCNGCKTYVKFANASEYTVKAS